MMDLNIEMKWKVMIFIMNLLKLIFQRDIKFYVEIVIIKNLLNIKKKKEKK